MSQKARKMTTAESTTYVLSAVRDYASQQQNLAIQVHQNLSPQIPAA